MASQQWLGGCKVRAGNRSIDSGSISRLAWNGWGVIESWKWHLLIALIQSCFTANWVWIWDLDSVSDLRWHVCKLLSTAGLWRLAVKLKVFLTYSSFRKSNSGVNGSSSHLHRWGACGETTWLILPVVICLSQRLSHACLSISFYMVKLRMAH